MKHSRLKFRFNMIEILLALVVMAIGITSILALFCGGLKTAKNTRDEDQFLEISSYILNKLESRFISDWKINEDGSVSVDGLLAKCNSKLSSLSTEDNFSPASIEGDFIYKTDKGEFKQESFQNISTNRFWYQKVFKDESGVLVPEFAIAVRIGTPETADSKNCIKLDAFTSDLLNKKNLKENPDIEKAYKNLYKILIVEFSWPTDISYAQRNKRIYRLEIFNDKYAI